MREAKPSAEVKNIKTKDMVSRVVEDDNDEFESHFVENPFIKIR